MIERYPIAFRKAIEERIKPGLHDFLKFRFIKDQGIAVYYLDNYKYHFLIYSVDDYNKKLYIKRKPKDELVSDEYSIAYTLDEIGDVFEKWIEVVRESIEYKSPINYKKIYKKYDDELFKIMQFKDSPKYNNLLPLRAQEQILNFLESLKKGLNEIPDQEKHPDIKYLENDIENTQKNIGQFNKRTLIKLIVRYLSVIRTHLFPIFKNIVERVMVNKIIDLIDIGLDKLQLPF